jgi:hypothetical protein
MTSIFIGLNLKYHKIIINQQYKYIKKSSILIVFIHKDIFN